MQNPRVIQQQVSGFTIINAVVDLVRPVPLIYQGNFRGSPVAVNRTYGTAVIQLRVGYVNHAGLALTG